MNSPSPEYVHGRRLVWVVVYLLVAQSVITIVLYNVAAGQGRLSQQLVRLGLTIVLAFFLVSGERWARWVTAVLSGIASVLAIGGGALAFSRGDAGWLLVQMGVVYGFCTAALSLSDAVSAYFEIKGGGS
jgi:hypothetical protein